MEVKSTFSVKFENGVGHLQFPANIKWTNAAAICCYNLYLTGDNENNEEECLSLKCDSSYFREGENFHEQLNTLALFPAFTEKKYFSFQNPPLPLTVAPEIIYFRIVDKEEAVKEISAIALIHIDGTCKEKVRHI